MRQGGAGLQAGEGPAGELKFRLQVRGRGIGPLRPDGLLPVEDAVKQTQPQVGHAHFVEVRKEQGQPQGNGPGVFKDGVDLPAQITGGALHAAEKGMMSQEFMIMHRRGDPLGRPPLSVFSFTRF